jgi:hypothetical protein
MASLKHAGLITAMLFVLCAGTPSLAQAELPVEGRLKP